MIHKVIAFGVDSNIIMPHPNSDVDDITTVSPLELLLCAERYTGYGQSRKKTTLPIVQCLLSVGADPSSKGTFTALGIAISRRMIEIVQALLEAISWVFIALEGKLLYHH
jgi:hypothetical protein